jgi:hypothetical protein
MDQGGNKPWQRRRRHLFAMDLLYAKNLLKHVTSLLSSNRDEVAKIGTLGSTVIDYHLRRISIYLVRVFGPIVQSGPFKGMSLVPEAPSSLLCPKILGTYETEIHAAIATKGRYDRLINIGSGEGYFAVGTLMIDPELTAVAFDILPKARELTDKLAEMNHVSGRLEIQAECGSETMAELAKPRSLFLIDIEGAELGLFEPCQRKLSRRRIFS